MRWWIAQECQQGGVRWEPERKGNYYSCWEEDSLYIFLLRQGKDVNSRAGANTFEGEVAGKCEHSIVLSFALGPSWLGIRIKALTIDSWSRDGHNLFYFLGFLLGFCLHDCFWPMCIVTCTWHAGWIQTGAAPCPASKTGHSLHFEVKLIGVNN